MAGILPAMRSSLALALSALLGLAFQPSAPPAFVRSEAMIPMRDGTRLYTEILIPANATEPLPFLFTRTPYGVLDDDHGIARGMSAYEELARDGYIFVFQDIRGRYKSEGTFVMQRPPRRDRTDRRAIDESTDAYDTIDWLLKNVTGHNGRVGILGISYGGWLTTMAMLDPHPALKAVAEQASPADMFLGDDFHHNGAFRLSYGFEYATEMETGKENYFFKFDRPDLYDWYLSLGPLSNVNRKYLHEKVPTWNDFVEHSDYDGFWQYQSFAPHLTRVTVPTLNVAGWWDQEDFYGPMKIYELLERHDANHQNYVVAGPWNHGGWARPGGDHLGPVQFGSDTSAYYREKIQVPWFAHWLKDRGPLPLDEALMFETGSNRWHKFDAWPPKSGIAERNLYFHEGEQLTFDAPSGATAARAYDEYVSDPGNPVPYRHRPIGPTYPGPGWPTWLVEDQHFVDHRPDVLTYATAPLVSDVSIAGDIVAHLFASTSGTDSDWIVKLIDQYPDENAGEPAMAGYELMISNEVFRGRFRHSFEKPAPIVANQVTPYTIDLHTNSHAFLKGHRIVVQIQSTWFPIIDRNPQTFVPNIFKAAATDYRKATQRIYRSARYASHVTLPVIASKGLTTP